MEEEEEKSVYWCRVQNLICSLVILIFWPPIKDSLKYYDDVIHM